jgi:fatty acid desaturase
MKDRLPDPDLRMERFAKYIVAGGLALVAGLWAVELTAFGTIGWVVGLALVLLGIAGLSVGIHREVEY